MYILNKMRCINLASCKLHRKEKLTYIFTAINFLFCREIPPASYRDDIDDNLVPLKY